MISLCRYFFTFSSVVIFLYAILTLNYPYCLLGIFLLLLGNILYTLQYWKDFLVVFIFINCFSLFLVGRPLIRYCSNHSGWLTYSPKVDSFVFTIIYLGLLSIYLGMAFYRFFHLNRLPTSDVSTKHSEINLKYQTQMAKVSLAIFCLGWICEIALGIEKILFMIGRNYADFFKVYEEMAPLPVRTLATFMPFAMCVYLATKPCKKKSILVLIMYIFAQIPTLLIGLRGKTMLAVLFAVIYFLIRNTYDKKEIWMGKVEKICMALGIPITMIGLNIINYVRSGLANMNTGILSEMADFIDKQGVSYFTLGYGYNTYRQIPDGFHSYTLGPLIDYIIYGPIGQILFGTRELPKHNSVDLAIRGNRFQHLIAYINHPHYLDGEGYGSSYVLELFADFGWVGVIVGGAMVIYYICYLPKTVNQGNPFIGAFMLYTLTSLLWIPRDSFLCWIDFIVTPQFWLFVIVLVVATNTLYKYDINRSRMTPNSVERY